MDLSLHKVFIELWRQWLQLLFLQGYDMKVNSYLKSNFWKTFRKHHYTFQNPGLCCWKVNPLSLLQTTDKIWISMLIIGYNSLMKPCIRERFLMIYLSYVVRKIFIIRHNLCPPWERVLFVLCVQEHI